MDPDELMAQLQQALEGRYWLKRRLGEGGMGIVHLAWDPSLERWVALKILLPAIATEAHRARFLKEAKVAARLTHDHIVPIYAVDSAGPFDYYTMEYIHGVTLEDRIFAEGPLPVADVTRILRDVALALHYAHAQGVVHRDLKPSNILIAQESGRAYVTDFGVARVLSETAPPGRGRTFGTCEYISPEQAAGFPADARSDVYALGLIAWAMATGQQLFGGSPREILKHHLQTPVPPLGVFGRHMDTTLARAVARCLAKDPVERFQTAGELAWALSQAPELAADLPPMLREFVTRLQVQSRSATGGVLLGLSALTVLGSALDGGNWGRAAGAAAFLALVVASPLVGALPATRRLLAQGYGRADIVHALKMERDRQRQQLAERWGKAGDGESKWARAFLKLSLGLLAVGTAAALIGITSPFRLVLGSIVAGAFGTAIAGGTVVVRERRLNQLWGNRWLKFWDSALGGWAVKLAAVGMGGLGSGRDLAALHGPGSVKALPSVVDWAEVCARRGREYLTTSQAAREREQRAPTEEQVLRERTLEHHVLLLEVMVDRFAVPDPVTGVPGTLTEDLEAMRQACEAVEALIEGKKAVGLL